MRRVTANGRGNKWRREEGKSGEGAKKESSWIQLLPVDVGKGEHTGTALLYVFIVSEVSRVSSLNMFDEFCKTIKATLNLLGLLLELVETILVGNAK